MNLAGKWAISVLVTAVMAAGQTAPPSPPAPPVVPQQPAPEAKAQTEADAAKARSEAAKARAEARKARAEARRAMVASRRGSSYLGVDIRDVTPEQVGPLKLKESRGVEITMVDQDAPAGKAGLREHDVILSFNGQNVNDVEQLRGFIRDTAPGTEVALGISRDGQAMTMKPQLASRKHTYTLIMPPGSPGKALAPMPPMPPMPPQKWEFDFPQFTVMQFSSRNGATVEDLTPQLADYFGVRNGEGVLVRSVEKGSPADVAGLRAGDVITKVDSEPIACSSDWRRNMGRRKSGTVNVGIVRDKREQTLSMKLPERSSSDAGGYHIEVPDMDEMADEVSAELRRLEPEIRRSVQQAQVEAARELQRSMREMQRELEQAQREMQRDMERERREAEREQRELQREQERERQQQEREQQQQQRENPPQPPQ